VSWPPRCSGRGTRGRVEPAPVIDAVDMIPRELLPAEIRHLERVYQLEESDVLARLLAWKPTEEDDKAVKQVMLVFAQRVIAEYEQARRSISTTRRK
jgi:hypothetical protein